MQVVLGILLTMPFDKLRHFRRHVFRQNILMYFTGFHANAIRFGFICAQLNFLFHNPPIGRDGIGLVWFFQQDSVHLADGSFRERLFPLNEQFEKRDEIVMSPDVEMILDRFAVCGQTFQKKCTRLTKRQRVAFDGIGMVVPVEPEFLHDTPLDFRLEWSKFVYFHFERVYLRKQFV